MTEEERLRKYSFEGLTIYLHNRMAMVSSNFRHADENPEMKDYYLGVARQLAESALAHAKEVIECYEPWKPRERHEG